MLRAAVWARTQSFTRATRVAGVGGQIVAFAFIGLGLLLVLGGNFLNGIWLVLVGWFLQNAAAANTSQVTFQQLLRGVRVGQVMTRDCVHVPGYLSLERIIEDRVLVGGQRCFFVTEGERLLGMLTLRDLSHVPREEWGRVPASQVMVPDDRLFKTSPDEPLLSALRVIDTVGVAQMPVVDRVGQLVGSLSRDEITRYLRTRAELGV
jgi:CBS domain-containing protein